MKFLITTSILALSLSVFADHHKGNKDEWRKKWDAMSFEDAKKMDQNMISKKTSMMNEMSACVDKATTKAMLERCHDKMKEEHMEMRSEMKKDMDKKKM